MSDPTIYTDLDESYSFGFGDQQYIIKSKDIKIDDSNLVFEFARQASRYAYIAFLAAHADAAVREQKLMVKKAHSVAYLGIRDEFAIVGKKATEAMVEAACLLDEDLVAAQDGLLKAEEMLGVLKAIENSYRMRADMLVSLGTRQRVELEQTGFSMNEKKEKASPDSKMKELVKEIGKDTS